jgi:hypothetical protein
MIHQKPLEKTQVRKQAPKLPFKRPRFNYSLDERMFYNTGFMSNVVPAQGFSLQGPLHNLPLDGAGFGNMMSAAFTPQQRLAMLCENSMMLANQAHMSTGLGASDNHMQGPLQVPSQATSASALQNTSLDQAIEATLNEATNTYSPSTSVSSSSVETNAVTNADKLDFSIFDTLIESPFSSFEDYDKFSMTSLPKNSFMENRQDNSGLLRRIPASVNNRGHKRGHRRGMSLG